MFLRPIFNTTIAYTKLPALHERRNFSLIQSVFSNRVSTNTLQEQFSTSSYNINKHFPLKKNKLADAFGISESNIRGFYISNNGSLTINFDPKTPMDNVSHNLKIRNFEKFDIVPNKKMLIHSENVIAFRDFVKKQG